MMIETIFKTIFSKSEMFLLRNQRKFVVNLSTDESSESDGIEHTEACQYYSQLLKGAVRKESDDKLKPDTFDPDETSKLQVSNIQNGQI